MPFIQLTNFNTGGLSTTGKYYTDENSFADGANLNLHNTQNLGTLEANQKLRQLPFDFTSKVTCLTNYEDKLLISTESGLLRQMEIGTNDYEISDIGSVTGYTGYSFNTTVLAEIDDVSYWNNSMFALDHNSNKLYVLDPDIKGYNNSSIKVRGEGVYVIPKEQDEETHDRGISTDGIYIATVSGERIKINNVNSLDDEEAWVMSDIPDESGNNGVGVGINADGTVCVLYTDGHVVFGEIASDFTVSFATNRIKVVENAHRIELDNNDNLLVLDTKNNVYTYPITGEGTSASISTSTDTAYTDTVRRRGVSQYEGQLIFSAKNSIIIDGLTDNKIINAFVYNKYFYYLTRNGMGRWDPTQDFSDREDGYVMLRKGSDLHDAFEIANEMYIGDGNHIIRMKYLIIDDIDTLVLDALVIDEKYVVTALSETFSDLLIGTYENLYNPVCSLFRWNRDLAEDYTLTTQVAENKITGFIHNEAGHVLVLAGNDSNIYSWNGYSADFVSKSSIGYNPPPIIVPFVQFHNLPYYAADNGIYSYGHNNNAFQRVVNLEYAIEDADIEYIQTYNDTMFIVNQNKLYVLDEANKADAFITTNVLVNLANVRITSVDTILADLQSKDVSVTQIMPDGTEVVLEEISQGRPELVRFSGIKETMLYQFRVNLNADGNLAPTISNILINY